MQIGKLGKLGLQNNRLRTIIHQAINVLTKYGSSASLFLPGVGVVGGVTSQNWLDNSNATVDNPISLVVSASRQIKQELVISGNFSTSTGWGSSVDVGGFVVISGGSATLTNTTGTARLAQTLSFIPGRVYRVVVEVSGGSVSCYSGPSEPVGTLSIGTNTRYFVATSSSDQIGFRNFVNGSSTTIDNVSVMDASYLPLPIYINPPGWSKTGDVYTKFSLGWRIAGGDVSSMFVGKTYRITFKVVSTNGAAISVWKSNAVASNDLVLLISNPIVGETYTATTTITKITGSAGLWVDGDQWLGSIDSLSVVEIPSEHLLTQTSSVNRPILRRGVVNLIPNSTMQGATIGTPGIPPSTWSYSSPAGIQRSIVAKGNIDNIPYVDVRFFGTASAASDLLLDPVLSGASVASIGQNYTYSVTLALVSGTWPTTRPVNVAIFERNAGLSSVGLSSLDIRSAVPTGTPTSVQLTRTLTNATTASVSTGLRHSILIGESVDFTVRIMKPQLEIGTNMSAFVPTTTSATSSGTGIFNWFLDGNGDLFQTSITAGNTGYFCAGANFPAGRANYLWYAGAGTATSAGAMLRVLSNGVVQCGVGDGVTRTTADSSAITGHDTRVYEGGWDTTTVLVGVDGILNTAPRTQIVSGSIAGQIGGSSDAGTSLSILGNLYPVIIMNVLPNEADREILRQFIGLMSGVPKFTPRMFDPTIWYDPSDLSTLFQDVNGTVPVTSVGQQVGYMLDKSGRGNHAIQPVLANRPTLSARYNVLSLTENLDDPYWTKSNSSVSSARYMSPIGDSTAQKLVENDTTNTHAISVSTIVANRAYRISACVKGGERLFAFLGNPENAVSINLTTGIASNAVGTTSSISVKSLSNGWWRVSFTATYTNNFGFNIYSSLNGVWADRSFMGSSLMGIFIWGPDLRLAKDVLCGPEYQRVVSNTDYDTSGFLLYLSCDGIDDGMYTNNVDFSMSDAISFSCGIHKTQSGATNAIVFELSQISNLSSPGSFRLLAPSATDQYNFRSVGTAESSSNSADVNHVAPHSAIVSGLAKISTDTNILRVNGTQTGATAVDQGTGNYGIYQLFLFRRAGSSLPFNGRFYGLTITNSLLSEANIRRLETYTNSQTGAY